MLRLLPKLLFLFAAVQILGGHWAVLQTVAWVGMTVEFAQTESLGSALEKTFSGENPCGLCHAVERGVGEEKKHDIKRAVVKLEAVLAPLVVVPRPKVAQWNYPLALPWCDGRDVVPPTPPPLV